MQIHNKKLYKSTTNRVVSGVLGGLGEYFDVDPVLFRVLYLGFCAFTAFIPGILAYFVMAAIMPNRPPTIHEPSH